MEATQYIDRKRLIALFLLSPNRPVVIGHGGVIQVKILAHLWDKLHLLVDAIEGQRSHGKHLQCLIRDVLISPLVDLKSLVAVLRSEYLMVHPVQRQH